MNASSWLLVITSASCYIAANALSAVWAKQQSRWILLLIFGFSMVGYYLFALMNKQRNLTLTAGIIDMTLLIGTMLVGILYFKDRIDLRQGIGIGFAIVAIVLMSKSS